MKLFNSGGRHRKRWWTRAAHLAPQIAARYTADRISVLLAAMPAY
ncbi:hypothetical protein TIN4_38 [Tsukamurella phage TIN4]|uniref:Uncharacterized protein n=2 Tax=Tinduovirus TIN3 TaxID=1982571 RepID=A0A0K0N604_9CAUD|nr:hypothetical protein AVT54_gp087 [Tsukamurella phage TIN3]YP_009604168.1 hypothetical protein FDH87_gp087 [Tsukamurella phage TIN4]AKJ71835.1 hypothetical protein TIN3_38 [Tsukamurella phage TIN3]AKJ71944.1 hypothetical protein TIN4_38 [Tsukamurella phage TIN4]